jgi:hypothetical protein
MNRINDNLICTGSNERIVRAFVENDVEFLIVGGLAVSWYCVTRQADDMDILVNPTIANSAKIHRALSELNLSGIPESAFANCGKQLQLKEKSEYYADIITPAINGITFDEAKGDSIEGKCFNIPVFIPSIENLIKLKKVAEQQSEKDAAKHRIDIELLTQCLKRIQQA